MTISKQPTWNIKPTKSYLKLTGDTQSEVVVVGGGLAGILTAYQLIKNGISSVVIEKGTIGAGATMYTTAFITKDIDTDVSDLLSMYGKRSTKMIWDSGQAAIDTIERIVNEEKIDCEFVRCDLVIYAQSDSELESLNDEYKTLIKLGIDAAMVEGGGLGFPSKGHMIIPRQAKFHPEKFLQALAQITAKMGVRIYEKTEATGIEVKDEKTTIQTKRGNIAASKLVMATYRPFVNPIQLFLKKGTYVSYVYEAKVKRGLIAEGMYLDMHNPYHYFRIDSQGSYDRMIVGGEDHRQEIKMDEKKNYKALKEYLDSILDKKDYSIVRQWNGPILEPSDGLALIGEYQPNKYVATAFSGNGMTYSMISALIISDLIRGKKNPWSTLYDPKRIPSVKQLAKKAKDYTEEFFHGAVKNIFKK